MSYFNPKIYNKQNLKEADKKELDYYEGMFHTTLDNVREDYSGDIPNGLADVVDGIIGDFVGRCKEWFGYCLQDETVGIIDGYEEEAEEIEDFETYLYNADDEDDEEVKGSLDEVDLKELRDRYGDEVEKVVRDMLSGKNERFKDHDGFFEGLEKGKLKETDGSEDK